MYKTAWKGGKGKIKKEKRRRKEGREGGAG
jgi:hypothetical protein